MSSNQNAIIEMPSELSSEYSNEEQDPAVLEYLKVKEHTKKMQLEFEQKKKITDAERIKRIKRRERAERRKEVPESSVVKCATKTRRCISMILIFFVTCFVLTMMQIRSGWNDTFEEDGLVIMKIIGIILLIIILPIAIFCAWINIWYYHFSDNKITAEEEDDTTPTNNEAV